MQTNSAWGIKSQQAANLSAGSLKMRKSFPGTFNREVFQQKTLEVFLGLLLWEGMRFCECVCEVRVNPYPGGGHPPQYDHKGAAKHRRGSRWEPENQQRATQPWVHHPKVLFTVALSQSGEKKGFSQHLEKKTRFVLEEKKQWSIF